MPKEWELVICLCFASQVSLQVPSGYRCTWGGGVGVGEQGLLASQARTLPSLLSILDTGQAQKQGVRARDPLGRALFSRRALKGSRDKVSMEKGEKVGTRRRVRASGQPDLTPAHRRPPAYFSLQVISARRVFRVSPPLTTGPPEFERVYRAQVNCSEYFPLFLATLWVAGIFFHEGTAALCGLVYLFARLRYFQGYARSAQQR
ncbi:leukotriene C4 synthase isoform X1 [Mirounga angustirostris]|uniref:leukotriene C4 synthase isoform X1 n=1 Tax=Mirounga angustirostris TaxID=9716 RepID=UPI00313BB5DC